MQNLIRSYDDWLALPHDGKVNMLSQWCPYKHEMFWVPMMAASRLAAEADFHVHNIYVGVDHGGVYVLRLYVRPEHLSQRLSSLPREFEGFPVIWTEDPYRPPISTELIGKWISEGTAGKFEFIVGVSDGRPTVSARSISANCSLEVLSISGSDTYIEFHLRQKGRSAGFHRLEVPSSKNCCNHHVSNGQFATLVENAG